MVSQYVVMAIQYACKAMQTLILTLIGGFVSGDAFSQFLVRFETNVFLVSDLGIKGLITADTSLGLFFVSRDTRVALGPSVLRQRSDGFFISGDFFILGRIGFLLLDFIL